MAVVLRLLPNEEAEARLIDLSDLLPALKGWFSQPLTGGSLVPPICSGLHLSFGGLLGGQNSPRSPSSWAPKPILTRLISLSHPRPKGRGFQVVTSPLSFGTRLTTLGGCSSRRRR